MDPKLPLIAALAAFAGAMWYGFVRQTPERVSTGTVVGKTFKPEGTYQAPMPTGDRAFRIPPKIPIAAGYIFTVALDTPADTAATVLNEVMSGQFDVGQRVRVSYVVKGWGPIARKLLITKMKSENDST